jgi:hypothetical protein
MTARRGTAIASTAVATAVAVALATSGRAETAGPSKQTAALTTSHHAASERPRGPLMDCSSISGIGGSREFRSRWNLVVGPLALKGAAARPAYYSDSFGGNKFPVIVRGGHRVTVEVSRDARPGAGLVYGKRPANPRLVRDGYRVVTFIACRRGEYQGTPPPDGWPVSGWSGGVLARSPRCVPLLIWADDEPSPRRAVIHLGVRDCG